MFQSVNCQVLRASEDDERSRIFENVLDLSLTYKQKTQALLVKSAILKAGLVIKVGSTFRGGSRGHLHLSTSVMLQPRFHHSEKFYFLTLARLSLCSPITYTR